MNNPTTLKVLIHSLIINGHRNLLDKSKSTSSILTSLFKNCTNNIVNMEYNNKKVCIGIVSGLAADMTVDIIIFPGFSDYFIKLMTDENKKEYLAELYIDANVTFKQTKDDDYLEVDSIESISLTLKFVYEERLKNYE